MPIIPCDHCHGKRKVEDGFFCPACYHALVGRANVLVVDNWAILRELEWFVDEVDNPHPVSERMDHVTKAKELLRALQDLRKDAQV